MASSIPKTEEPTTTKTKKAMKAGLNVPSSCFGANVLGTLPRFVMFFAATAFAFLMLACEALA